MTVPQPPTPELVVGILAFVALASLSMLAAWALRPDRWRRD